MSYSGEPITLRCVGEPGAVCKYSLVSPSGKKAYSIHPGEAQNLKETTSWKVRYDQGAGWGEKSYKLRGGVDYVLKQTSDGWQLYKDD